MYISSNHSDGPFVVMSREEGGQRHDKSPTSVHTFEYYLLDAQKYVLEPLFFASIGLVILILDLWTGQAIWKGVVYTLLMLVSKFIVEIWVLIWSTVKHDPKKADEECQQQPSAADGAPLEQTLSSPHSSSRTAANSLYLKHVSIITQVLYLQSSNKLLKSFSCIVYI